jgi:hypothetical protein
MRTTVPNANPVIFLTRFRAITANLRGYFKLPLIIIAAFFMCSPGVKAQTASALQFDGVERNSTTDYVSVNSPFTAFNKEITVEFWMYTPSANMPYGSVMGQSTNNSVTNIVWLMHPNAGTTMTFYVSDGGTLRGATCNITAGSWHHYAGVASATSTKFYVDGVLVNTGAGISGTIVNNNSSVIHMGKDVRYSRGDGIGSDDPRFANMSLDEVRIWSRALCQEEIRNNMNCEPNPGSQTGLVEYYRFNQGVASGNNSGVTTLLDAAGSNRNGTLNNFLLTGATSNWIASGSTNIGTCAAFVAPTAPITGNTSLCTGNSTTLSNANSGGVWTSSNTAVATINASTGLVNKVGVGTTTITYTTECGGISTAILTVGDAIPPTITCPTNKVLASCETVIPDYTTSATVSDNCTAVGNIVITQSPAAGTIIAPGATVTVTLTAKDASNNPSTCTFTVNRPNVTPVANADAAVVCAGSSVNVNVLSNDSHPQGLTLIVSDNTVPSVGTLVKNANNTFTYTAPANYSGPVTFTYTTKANDGTQAFAGNGHYYEFVSSPGITWTAARAAASAKTFNGLQGYLVTITSAAENTFMFNKVGTTAWIGGSDMAQEGIWKWMDGPEAGQQFSNQDKTSSCGANTPPQLSGSYHNWGAGEPNDCGGSGTGSHAEDYAHFRSDGAWNDFPNNAGVSGYAVEYGGLEACTPVLTATATVTITVNAVNFTAVPTNQSANTEAGTCAATVNYTATASGTPTPSLNYTLTGATTGSGNGSGTGSTFNKGVTNVVITATNSCGIVSTNFTVTVNDNIAPTIVCPANQVLNLDATCSATLPDYRSLLTVSDNCTAAGSLVITQSPAAGTAVNSKGALIVTFTVTDASNNSSNCTITVDKKDVTAPAIVCPVSITVNNTANTCGAVVNYTRPTATDNCSGSAFNFFNAGEPNDANIAHEDYLQLFTSGTWNDLPNANLNRSIVEFNSVISTVFANYTLIGTFGGHTYYLSNGTASWTNSRIAAQAIGGDLASINTLGESQYLAPSGGNTWVGGYQDHSDPSYVEPGNASQNFGGWKWVDGTKLGAGQIAITQIGGLASGSVFPVGVTTNTWQAEDESGNQSTCSFTVTVKDVQAPAIACAPNQSVIATSASGAIVNYSTPVGTDNCSGVTTTLIAGLPSGSTFPLGITTVTYRATDAAGNSTNCSFTVNVSGLAPSVICPSNITVNNTPGQCGASVNFVATETTGIPASTITYSIQPGSNFPGGTTTVVATATNAVGVSTCSFTVTVNDNEPPVLTGVPANTSVECSSVPGIATVTASDNCGVSNSVNAYQFPSNTIHALLSHSYSFENILNDNKSNANGTPVGAIHYSPGIVGSSLQLDGTNYVELGNAASINGTVPFAISVWVKTTSNAGMTVISQRDGNVNGEYTLNIGTNHAGTISNPGKVYLLIYNGGFQADFFGNKSVNDGKWHHIVAEREGTVSRIFVDGILDASASGPLVSLTSSITSHIGKDTRDGSKNFVGSIDQLNIISGTTCANTYDLERTWSVADLSGNQTAGQQIVSVADHTAPVLLLPADIVVNNTPGICGAPVSFTATATDNCSTATVTYSVLPGSLFTVGTTPVTVTAKDACGNTTIKTFNVTVKDNEAPVPDNPSLPDIIAECNVIIPNSNYPTAIDNCAGKLTATADQNTSFFNQGSYVITWTYHDGNGNDISQQQNVIVKDITPPTIINCVQDKTLLLDANCSVVLPDYISEIAAADNCTNSDKLTIVQFPAPGTVLNGVNVSSVTFTVFDAVGLSTSCNMNVTTKDIIAPSITIPSNVTLNCQDNSSTSATGVATGTDNCSPVAIAFSDVSTQSSDVNSAGHYNYTITRTWTATDVSGNQNNGVQTITVHDITAPVITVPASVTLNCQDNSSTSATGVATGIDICSPVAIASSDVSTQSSDVNNAGHYNYTITRTWTATDVSGNQSSGVQTITVQDITAPVITVPSSVTLNCQDNSSTSATGVAAGIDICSPVAIASSDVSTQSSDVNSAGHYNYTITRTWTATDVSGNQSSGVQTITVHDITAPVITVPANVTLNCQDNSSTSATGVAAGIDICSPVAIASSDLSTQSSDVNNAAHYNYTITRTWTATDVSGNASSGVQTITVQDITAPVLTVPVPISAFNDKGVCSAKVVFAATAGDNCSPITITYSQNPGTIFPVGITTVTVTAKDVTGNTTTNSFTVNVTDNEGPVINCPGNQVFCANTGGNTNYTIPVLVQSDNCGILSTTYTVTGATIRTGTGVNASGIFNVGVSTVTFTVTDIHSNVSTCNFTVTINPLPAASFVSTNADQFCNQVTLTASSSINPSSYSWTTASTPGTFVTSSQYVLGQTSGDGNYNVFVKVNATGCTSEFPAVYNFQKQNLASSYTIIAYKEAEIGDYSTVASGSIGVLSSKGEAEIGKYSKVVSPGSFVKAVKIDLDKYASVTQPIYAAANPVLPTMYYNTANTKSLPNYEVKGGTVILSGNYGNLNIKKGSVVTLSGNTFGTIHTEEGAQLTFTQSNVSIDNLKLDKGPETGYTYVHFAQNSKILVSKSVSIGDQVYLNPDNNKVTFYVGAMLDPKKDDDDWGDDAKFTVNGKDVKVTVNVMMPNGKMKVNGGDNDNSKGTTTYIYMTGLFVATEVESEGKNVIWNSFDCSAGGVSTNSSTSIAQAVNTEKSVSTSEEELKVTVMPNPTTTYFTLKLESKYETPVNMRVMDARGRVIDAKSQIGSNSTIQIGHNYSSGTYYAEMIQGTKRKVIQLIKGKG